MLFELLISITKELFNSEKMKIMQSEHTGLSEKNTT
jgi:hypothetical protein